MFNCYISPVLRSACFAHTYAYMYIFADLCMRDYSVPRCTIRMPDFSTVRFHSSRQDPCDSLILKNPSDRIFVNFPPTAWSTCAALTTTRDVRKFRKRKCRRSSLGMRDKFLSSSGNLHTRKISSLKNLLACRELIHRHV